ncbi:MAG: NAD+ diphosphatase [Cognaticolwellia sp.]|jgi:NAD+ diphosphatase
MDNSLTFCQMPLDRASTLRKNGLWLQDKRTSKDSHFYFYWRGEFLYFEQEICIFSQKSNVGLDGNIINVQLFTDVLDNSPVTFLGTNNNNNEEAHFVCNLSRMNEIEIKQWLVNIAIEDIKFIDFRRSISLLNHQQAAVLSYAKALIHWQQSALFCGCCGGETQTMDGGHRQICVNESCQKQHFPRTDPAVIMLVEYQPQSGPAVCLLAEHHRTPEQVFSTLAGFVDPGESLEEAVTREVFEEAGIEVSNVCYIDSQPWPFPNSLMIGFIAQAQSMILCLEEAELRSAGWFTAQQLAEFNDWGDEVDGPKLPRKESISRLLIDLWCERQLSSNADLISE